MPLAAQVEAGNVSILRADWNRALTEEMQNFPWGRKDDQVDALVRAFNELASQRRAPGLISFPLLGR
jgi:predicted phage terminase large subunit-like protein